MCSHFDLTTFTSSRMLCDPQDPVSASAIRASSWVNLSSFLSAWEREPERGPPFCGPFAREEWWGDTV
jgi:hypothetical protein